MNQQEHDYMHAHGIEHTHHDEINPNHAHPHSACEHHEGCSHDCSGCSAVDPKSEALAIMQYMAKHNIAHAAELSKLGKRMYEIGEKMAGDQIMQAVADYEKGNMRLATVLAAMGLSLN